LLHEVRVERARDSGVAVSEQLADLDELRVQADELAQLIGGNW